MRKFEQCKGSSPSKEIDEHVELFKHIDELNDFVLYEQNDDKSMFL